MDLRDKLHNAIDELMDGIDKKDALEHNGKLHIGLTAMNEESDFEKMRDNQSSRVDFKHIITIHF